MAFAPSRDLSGVPSRSTSFWSTIRWSTASTPFSSGPISSSTSGDGLLDALAGVALGVPVPQLDRLVLAGRRTGRDRRAGQRAVVEGDLHLDGGVTARVQDLTRTNLLDNRHVHAPQPVQGRLDTRVPSPSFPRWRHAHARGWKHSVTTRWIFRNSADPGSVGATMTGDAQDTFEAFRRAESLVAQRRPLDALAALGTGAGRGTGQVVGAPARRPRLPRSPRSCAVPSRRFAG